MREIKYQYWDFKDRKMSTMEDNGVIRKAYKSEDTSVWQDCSLGLLVMRHHENKGALREYTGLKDKSGKDVFDGDIIQSARTKLNYIIGWDGESASWIALCTDTSKDFHLGSYGWDEAEIIGNTYESPELLEAK